MTNPKWQSVPSETRFAIDQERREILQQLDEWLDIPLLVLSFIWLILFIAELIWGLNPLLEAIGVTIWAVFILDFAIMFLLAPQKRVYLRQNWLIAISLILPALRVFRIFRVIRVLQSARAIRSLRLLQVMARTNRGMRALAASMNRRGFGYAVALTTIVLLSGAAGIYAFEAEIPESGITDYGAALWWTAMLLTSIGSDYFPRTAEGRVLCFLLALYGFAVFGYLTATLATFFIGRDAENPRAEVAGAAAITQLSQEVAQLQSEITALRSEIQTLLHQK